jgi:hypothetical protein
VSVPQSNSQSDPLDRMLREMSDDLGVALARDHASAAAPTRGAVRQAPPGPQMWGPTTPRDTSPLQLLGLVADNAHWLQDQVAALVADITGEEPPTPRQRAVPKNGGGLLPAIGHFAHEIETCQREIARLIKQLGGKLP